MNLQRRRGRNQRGTPQIKATMVAAIMDTVHEGNFNTDYVWEMCNKDNAEIIKQAEDIRWKWYTHANVMLFFDVLKMCIICVLYFICPHHILSFSHIICTLYTISLLVRPQVRRVRTYLQQCNRHPSHHLTPYKCIYDLFSNISASINCTIFVCRTIGCRDILILSKGVP